MLSPLVTKLFKGTVSIHSSAPRDRLSSNLSVVSTWLNPIVLGGRIEGAGFFLNGHIVNRTLELTGRGIQHSIYIEAKNDEINSIRAPVESVVRQHRYGFWGVPLVARSFRRYSSKGGKPSLARRWSTLASSSIGCGTFSPFSFRVSIIPYSCFLPS
jgi:hypothetical protein